MESLPNLAALSIVGHSLGGLFVRFALKLLADPQFGCSSDAIEFRTFMTIASPHLGCRQPWRDPFTCVLQAGAINIPYFQSAHELWLVERRPAGQPPLLLSMATQEGTVGQGKHRLCFTPTPTPAHSCAHRRHAHAQRQSQQHHTQTEHPRTNCNTHAPMHSHRCTHHDMMQRSLNLCEDSGDASSTPMW